MEIFKYSINAYNPVNKIQIPKCSKIISAKVVNNEVKLWALVDAVNPFEERTVLVWPTGKVLPDYKDIVPLDTVVLDNGSYVAHIFIDRDINFH